MVGVCFRDEGNCGNIQVEVHSIRSKVELSVASWAATASLIPF